MWSGGHYNMFVVKGVHKLKCVVSRSGMASLRSLSGTSNVSKQNNDMPIDMENPFKQPEKRCILCNVAVDYKNIQLLSQFVSPHTGRIYGRHMTGLCGTKQREVSKAIKKAHSMGFMPVTHKYPQFMKDPIICNVRHMD